VAGDAYPSHLLVRGGGGGWWVTRTLRVCLGEVVVVGGMRPGDVALSRGCRFRSGIPCVGSEASPTSPPTRVCAREVVGCHDSRLRDGGGGGGGGGDAATSPPTRVSATVAVGRGRLHW